jgi:hypothetical protein
MLNRSIFCRSPGWFHCRMVLGPLVAKRGGDRSRPGWKDSLESDLDKTECDRVILK